MVHTAIPFSVHPSIIGSIMAILQKVRSKLQIVFSKKYLCFECITKAMII